MLFRSTQVAVVSASSHGEDAETARACRVGREWGQRAAWWSLGAPPGGALPRQEDDPHPPAVLLSLSLAPVPGAQALGGNS